MPVGAGEFIPLLGAVRERGLHQHAGHESEGICLPGALGVDCLRVLKKPIDTATARNDSAAPVGRLGHTPPSTTR